MPNDNLSPDRDFTNVRRVVVKVGSAVLAGGQQLSRQAVARLARDICRVRRTGREVVLVSSGAVASGYRLLGLERFPATIVEKQAAAAIGQQRLMHTYAEAFAKANTHVAQVLLTGDDMDHRLRFLNARHTLQKLLAYGIVPIINENDSVSFEEIKLGDNDRLSALVANLVTADLLVLLSNVDGFLGGGDPPQVLPTVTVIDDVLSCIRSEKSSTGTGGMGTKIEAARMAGHWGIPSVVANGNRPGIVEEVLRGAPLGTFFPSRYRPVSARKRWLGAAGRPRGALTIDEGACRAIRQRGTSLLPAGVAAVAGSFSAGALVDILDPAGGRIARGLASYGSEEIGRIKGRKSSEISGILGYQYCEEVVHRNDMVVLMPIP